MKYRDANEKTMKLMCQQKAEKMWAAFNDNEKAGVRIGMFPHAQMMAADKEGYDPRLLALALMDQANADGGMIA